MKATERDDLLIRLDERTRNIWALTERQEEHLGKINDSLLKHAIQLSSNKTSIKWIIRVLVAVGILGGGATGIVNLIG